MPSQSLVHSIAANARRNDKAAALVWDDAVVSYGELWRMAQGAAAGLTTAEPRESPVGILAKKSPAAIALILGCLMTNRSFLLPSPELGQDTLDALFRLAGCALVCTPGQGLGLRLGDLANSIPVAEQELGPNPRPDDIGFMLTTSGSTGMPKIVPLANAGVDRFVAWAATAFRIGSGTKVLNYAPLNFDLCLVDVWATLAAGGCVVLVNPDHATKPAYLLDLFERHRIEVVQAVPLLYRLLTDAARGHAFDSVKHAVFTGDVMPAPCLRALPSLFPSARFYNLYGCTETNDSFLHEADPREMASGDQLPIGQPLPNVAALLVTADGHLLDGEGTGELLVNTPFQTRGFLDAALTAERFMPHPGDEDGRRYFRTGDVVRRGRDGTFTLVGRNDFQVKVRGVRVNTEEVEQVILTHEQVLEAAVFAVPDDTAGTRLHAVVRPRPGSALNSLELRRHCASRLPRVAIPSTIRLVNAALPRTSTGKIARGQVARVTLQA